MIRIDALWLATAPLDMRAGPDKALGRVVEVFGAARLHHAYLFANQRGTRMKVLVHDGQGLWLLARRLHQGRFVWPHGGLAQHIELNQIQPKNRSYPARSSTGGGVGKVILPTMRWQM
jgi:hypothetical protein